MSYKHKRIGGRKGKMRLAHHIVWEAINGPIPDGMLIHHMDQDKQNNDIENLLLVSETEHQRIHSPYYYLKDGEWFKMCKFCKNTHTHEKRTACDPCRARMARITRRKNQ